MDLEDLLKSFRLGAPAGARRARVLRAAGQARFEARLWHWTWRAAAVVLAIAVPVNVSFDAPPTLPAVAPRASLKARGTVGDDDPALAARLRLAQSPPSRRVRLEEVPWIR